MTDSKQSIEDMFTSQGGDSVGLQDSGTQIVVNNLNATTLPMCVGVPVDDIDTDDVTIVFFALDMSPSMEPVEQELIRGFNDIMIPGLKGASKKTAQTMVVGGLAFNERITPLWGGGFHKLDDVPLLSKSEYDTDSGMATALHQAMLDSLTAVSVYASNVLDGTGIPPKVIVVVLSDGANNCPPMDCQDVRTVTDQLSQELFVLAFAGFKTYERIDFKKIADETGFSAAYEHDGSGDADEQRRSFRQLLGVMSSSIIRQSQQQVSPTASANFWQQP